MKESIQKALFALKEDLRGRNVDQGKDTLIMDEARDSVDQANLERDSFARMRLSERDKVTMAQIEGAFEKLRSGDFGICEGCEEPIPSARLLANPLATLCVDCKEEEESDGARRKIRPGLLDQPY